ncbi:MAG: hypothetical protein U9O20_03050 [Patescibacteria group bacterium]|nr:hypothetical protein [Patescibacteria group bacterium]
MFGFGKKSKKTEKQKAIEFEIVTMESASENAPQTVVLNPENEKANKEEKKMIKRQKAEQQAKEAKMKQKQKEKKEEKRRQVKREKEESRIREKELQLEKENEKARLKAQKQLKEREAENKKKELELKKNEEKLKQKQAEIQQKKLEKEMEIKRAEQEEELKKQKELEKQMEKQEKLREKEAKEKARLEKIQLKQEKLKQEQARLEEEEKTEEANQSQPASPFLTEKEVKAADQQKVNDKIHEQAYAQALNTQRSEEMKEVAKEEMKRRQRLFAGRINKQGSTNFQQTTSTTNSALSSDLKTKEDTKTDTRQKKTEKKSFVKTKTQHKKTSFNKTLVSIAFLVFLVTLATGTYYYFFVIKTPGEEWTPIEIPEINISLPNEKTETSPDDNNNNTHISPILKSNILKKASLRSINPETFDEDLKKLILTLKSSPAQSETLKKGMFVKLAKANGQPIETQVLLGLLGINNQQLLDLSKDEIWLFLVKQQQNTLSEETSVININLVVSLSNKQERADLEGSVMLIEQALPSQCLGLFVDEEKPVTPEKISFQSSSTDSKIIPQTRFFNYEPGSSTKSIDWSIARYIDKNYLVISTSKNSTDRLLEIMK